MTIFWSGPEYLRLCNRASGPEIVDLINTALSYRKTHWKRWGAKPPTFSTGPCGRRGQLRPRSNLELKFVGFGEGCWSIGSPVDRARPSEGPWGANLSFSPTPDLSPRAWPWSGAGVLKPTGPKTHKQVTKTP